jgi:hypothetical protein
VPLGHGGHQALAQQAAAVAPRHVGGGRGLVEKDEPLRVHEALPAAPAPVPGGDVGPSCSAALSTFFVPQADPVESLVERRQPGAQPAALLQRRCSSTRVRWGAAATRRLNSPSCGASSGRRWPPKRAGAALPVARTRCISLIAADGLTAKRRATRPSPSRSRTSMPEDIPAPASAAPGRRANGWRSPARAVTPPSRPTTRRTRSSCGTCTAASATSRRSA